MAIHVASRRRGVVSLTTEFPGAQIIDVTSRAEDPWVRLSPFYPTDASRFRLYAENRWPAERSAASG